MAAIVRVVYTTADTGLTTPFEQTITTTNLGGATPIAVKAEVNYSNSGTVGAYVDHMVHSQGASDGTNEFCWAASCEDVNSGSTNNNSLGSTDYLGVVVDPTAATAATIDNSFTLKNFTTNGCVITWDSQPARASKLRFTFYVATHAEVGVETLATGDSTGTANTVTLTNSSLHPALGYIWGGKAAMTTGDNTAAGAHIGIGAFISDQAATPAIKQYCTSFAHEDGDSSPYAGACNYNSADVTARCFAYPTLPIANGTGSNELECTDTNAGSFEMTRRNAVESTTRYVTYLVIDFGGDVGVDLGTTLAGSGSTTLTQTPGWQPQYYEFAGTNVSAEGYIRGNLCSSFNTPSCVDEDEASGGVLGWKCDNRQNNSTDTHSFQAAADVAHQFGDNDATSWIASHNTFTSTTFTVSVDTAPGGNKLCHWLAVEQESATTVEFDPATLADTNTLSVADGLRTVTFNPTTLADTNTLAAADGLRSARFDPDALADTNTLSIADGLRTVQLDPAALADTNTLSTATGTKSAAAVTFDPDTLADTNTLAIADGLRTVNLDPGTFADTNTLAIADGLRTVALDPGTLADTNTLAAADGLRTVTFDPDSLLDTNTLTTATGLKTVGLDPDALADTNTLTAATSLKTVGLDPATLADTNTLSAATGLESVRFSPDTLADTNTLAVADGTRTVQLDADTLADTNTLPIVDGLRTAQFDPAALADTNTLSAADGLRAVRFDPAALADTNTLSIATGTKSGAVEFDPDTLADTNSLSAADSLRTARFDPSTLADTDTLSIADGLRTVTFNPDTLADTNTLAAATGLRTVTFDPGTLADTNTLAAADGLRAVRFVTDTLADTNTLSIADGLRAVRFAPSEFQDTNTLSIATGTKTTPGGAVEFDPDTLADTNTLSTAGHVKTVRLAPTTLADTCTLAAATATFTDNTTLSLPLSFAQTGKTSSVTAATARAESRFPTTGNRTSHAAN